MSDGRSLVVPVIRRADYWIGFEQFGDTTGVHCGVRRWSHTVARAIRADFDTAVRLHGGPIWAIGRDDPTYVHFLKFMGFRLHSVRTSAAGQEASIYERRLDG